MFGSHCLSSIFASTHTFKERKREKNRNKSQRRERERESKISKGQGSLASVEEEEGSSSSSTGKLGAFLVKSRKAAAASSSATPPPEKMAGEAQAQRTMVSGSLSFSSQMSKEDEEMSMSALSAFRAKEEEMDRKKLQIRERVQAQLGRVEEETKRLALIREELESLSDPMRKELAVVRKKIDTVNKDLKPLGQTVQKKEKEYKDAVEAFNDKNREKVQLITKLMELVSESETLRFKKLEELSKNIDSAQ